MHYKCSRSSGSIKITYTINMTILTDGEHQEERQPAQHEAADHNAQGLGGFLLAWELEQPQGKMSAAAKGLVLWYSGVSSVYPEDHLLWIWLLCLLALPQALAFSVSNHINSTVHGQYDGQGEVEGAHCREDSVARLLCYFAHGLVQWSWLFPAEQRSNRYDNGQHPQQHHCQQSPAFCHDGWVTQRITDSNVSVHRDHAQAHDGGSAAEHIHSCPNITEGSSKHPTVQDL